MLLINKLRNDSVTNHYEAITLSKPPFANTAMFGRVESWRGNPIEHPLSVSGVSPFVPG